MVIHFELSCIPKLMKISELRRQKSLSRKCFYYVLQAAYDVLNQQEKQKKETEDDSNF